MTISSWDISIKHDDDMPHNSLFCCCFYQNFVLSNLIEQPGLRDLPACQHKSPLSPLLSCAKSE